MRRMTSGCAAKMPRQPRHQPVRGKGRRDRNREHAGLRPLGHRHRALQFAEAGGKSRRELRAEFRRLEAGGCPLEHLPADLRLGAADLLADRARRHAEFVGRLLQRPAARHRLDRAQPVEMHRIERHRFRFSNIAYRQS